MHKAPEQGIRNQVTDQTSRGKIRAVTGEACVVYNVLIFSFRKLMF